jgi:phosphoribosylpyrophosphate synthetase
VKIVDYSFEFPICDHLQVMHLIGDVKGKVAIMVDDMIDTAG